MVLDRKRSLVTPPSLRMSQLFSKQRIAGPLVIFCLVTGIAPCLQTPAAAEETSVNYSYFSEFGTGAYDTDDRTGTAVNIPFSHQLRPIQDSQSGLKLLLPITVGILSVNPTDATGTAVPTDFSILSVVPGLEIQIPVHQNWTLKPFGKIGIAWNTSGDESALVYSTGLKSSVEFPWRDFIFTLGNALILDGDKVSGEERNDFTSVAIGLDAFYPLGMALRGRETHIGGWIGYYYYLDDLAFERAGMEPLRVDHEFEIAITFGTYTPIPFGFLKFRRIGIAYRFSGDLKVYRLVFEFPF
jgi:hypothetical protein